MVEGERRQEGKRVLRELGEAKAGHWRLFEVKNRERILTVNGFCKNLRIFASHHPHPLPEKNEFVAWSLADCKL